MEVGLSIGLRHVARVEGYSTIDQLASSEGTASWSEQPYVRRWIVLRLPDAATQHAGRVVRGRDIREDLLAKDEH